MRFDVLYVAGIALVGIGGGLIYAAGIRDGYKASKNATPDPWESAASEDKATVDADAA